MCEENSKAQKKLEKDWRAMIAISHDFFHSWRQVVEEKFGTEEAAELINRFWERVGEGSGQAYLKRGFDTENIEQFVSSMVRVSLIMGESARIAQDGKDYLLIHDACPWVDTFRNYGAAGQCQAGCDAWFIKALEIVSPEFTVTTESSLGAGDKNCTRRYSRKG